MHIDPRSIALLPLLALPLSAQEAWVSNTSGGSLSVLDTASLTVVDSIPLGGQPARTAFSADGLRAFVPRTGADALCVLSAEARTVEATIAVVDGPNAVVLIPGERAYVAGANGIVGVVDLAAGVQTGTIVLGAPAAGYSVAGIAVSPDGSRVFANWGNLFEIDTATDTVTRATFAGVNPAALALTADGSRCYVSATFGYPSFSFYGSVVVIDTAALEVTGTIFTWALPAALSLDSAGSLAHVSTPSTFVDTGYGAGFLPSPWVSRLDLASNGLAGGVNVGAAAAGHALSRDEARLLVAVPSLDAVKVVERATNTVVASVPVGDGPTQVVLRPTRPSTSLQAGRPGRRSKP